MAGFFEHVFCGSQNLASTLVLTLTLAHIPIPAPIPVLALPASYVPRTRVIPATHYFTHQVLKAFRAEYDASPSPYWLKQFGELMKRLHDVIRSRLTAAALSSDAKAMRMAQDEVGLRDLR